MYQPLPANHDGCYFAVAMANWAINYSDRRRPDDHWWVVRVVIKNEVQTNINRITIRVPPPRQYPREFMANDPRIIGRYRHPVGRLYKIEETYPVVDALNARQLSTFAAATGIGGVGRLVRQVACEVLYLNPQTGVEINE